VHFRNYVYLDIRAVSLFLLAMEPVADSREGALGALPWLQNFFKVSRFFAV